MRVALFIGFLHTNTRTCLQCHLRADDAFASSLDVGCWLEVLSLSCYDWTTFKEFCWLIAAAVNSTDSEDASVTTVKRRKEDTDVTCTVVDIGQRPLAVAAMTAFGNRFQAVVVGSTDEDADVLLVSRWLYGMCATLQLLSVNMSSLSCLRVQSQDTHARACNS